MGARFEAEWRAHRETAASLAIVRANFRLLADTLHEQSVELVDARVSNDRGTVERARLVERVRLLDEENEALRNQIAVLALSAGGGARL